MAVWGAKSFVSLGLPGLNVANFFWFIEDDGLHYVAALLGALNEPAPTKQGRRFNLYIIL